MGLRTYLTCSDSEITEAGFGSLPVPIKLFRPKKPLSLASYRPDVVIAEQPRRPRSSSAAIRRAVYAERDQRRSLDPGALDFPLDDEDEDDDDVSTAPSESGDRGRKRALKILQARSSVPEAGMWRSLA